MILTGLLGILTGGVMVALATNSFGADAADGMMIFTGLRKGEVRHLEWSDVDLKHRLLHVLPS